MLSDESDIDKSKPYCGLTNIDFEDMFSKFLISGSDMIVASSPYSVNLPYGILETNKDKIISLKEKPTFTYFSNAGIYIIKKKYVDLIPENEFFNATDLMNAVVNEKGKLIHFPITGYWLDIGKHKDFEKAHKDISHIDFD